MTLPELIARSPLWRQSPAEIAVSMVMLLAFVAVALAVIADFTAYHRQPRAVVGSAHSLVETGTMTLYFVGYYLVVRLHVGECVFGGPARAAVLFAGVAHVIVGVAFNIWGRLTLKSEWANQATIYEGHRLVTTGPFSVVRHPLYASLIWTFVGGSLVYANVLSLLATLAVFVPMMYVRARKEDALLLGAFGEQYEQYRARTPLFVPRPWRH